MGCVLVGALLVCKQQKTGVSNEGELLVPFTEQPACTGFRYGWTQGLILGPYLFFPVLSPAPFLCSSFLLMLPSQLGSLAAERESLLSTFPARVLRLSDVGHMALSAPWHQSQGPLLCHLHPYVHRGKTQERVQPHLNDRPQ